MNFFSPELLNLFWAMPLIGYLIWFANRRKTARLKLFSSVRLGDLLSLAPKPKVQFLKAALIMIGISTIILALSRPRWGYEWKEVPKGGVDIMVVLDLSQSMLATDIHPNRLERAKREIIDLLGMLEGDRLGIVAFAGIPFVQCPLTLDYRLASLFISQLSIDLIPVQGTALGDAIKMAVESLNKASSAESEGKAIILITDGEDQEKNTASAISLAKKSGVNIYAIGIGSEEGAPIPLKSGSFKKDPAGNVIISKLDEKTLQEAAQASNGFYVRSTTGDLDLDLVYKQGIKAKLNPHSYGESRQKLWYERFQYFVLIALLTLFAEAVLSEFKQKTREEHHGA